MKYKNAIDLFQALQVPALQKKVFAQIGNKKHTYGQLLENINKLHFLFRSAGLKKGDKVVLSTDDDYYIFLFFLAFLRYGVTTVLIDPDVPSKRANALVRKAEVQGMVMDEELFSARDTLNNPTSFLLKIKKGTQKKGKLFKRLMKKKTNIGSSESKMFPAILNSLPATSITLDNIERTNLAYVLFTSGTTSEPKGVMITHGNLFAHLQTLSKVYALNKESRLLNVLTLYHVDGLIQGPMLAAFNEGTLIRPFRFDLSKMESFFNTIYKYRITHFIAVPTILSFMTKFSDGYEDSFITEDFQFVVSAASKLELKLWTEFEKKFQAQIVNLYGLTETVTGSLFCGLNGYPRKLGTVGVPIDCEAKIVNEDGIEIGINKEGNLWLKGEHIFAGYLNDPKTTQEVMKDGWLNTGDIAVKDTGGFYKITGRAKNVIISGGINIYPEQVTEMVNTNPMVLESVCFGKPDEIFGEKLVCALVVEPSKSLTPLELVDYLRPLLEQNLIPKDFYFLAELPKGLSGKIQVKKVQTLIEQQLDVSMNLPIDNYLSDIKIAASEAFRVPVLELKMEDNSTTLEGWDSMAHLLFITTLEKKFKIRFSTVEMMTMNSLKTAEHMLNQKIVQG